MSEDRTHRERTRRLWRVLAAFILTASVSGFFMGLQGNRSRLSLTRPVEVPSADSQRRAESAPPGVRTAVRYDKVDRKQDGPNAGWATRLASLPRLALESGSAGGEAERAAAIALRTQRRAFDGAPPVIPHPIQQDTSAACLACHAEGLRIKDRVASKISHPPYANCTQCHAPAGGSDFGERRTEEGSRRPPEGSRPAEVVERTVLQPTAGTRATPGAPPTIPHGLAMRSECLSCHGPGAPYGLRTSHPERQSCLQCHASQEAQGPSVVRPRTP